MSQWKARANRGDIVYGAGVSCLIQPVSSAVDRESLMKDAIG
jgi:hypothetical protein